MKKISIIIFLLFSLSFYINVTHPIIPISYDEAWNWTYIASNGPWYALTNYPAANNHVFFTFLQSFITPRFLLWYFPEISRLLNVILGISLVVVIWVVFGRLLKNKSIWLLLGISVVCFFVSPLTTLFFIVARGYLLATFLLFCGIYVISQKKYFTASGFFILAGWTILTYTYTLPLIYTATFFYAKKIERKKVIFSALIIPVVLLVCYYSILSAVLIQGKIWPTGTLQNFLYMTWQSISNFPYLPYDKIIFPHMPQEIIIVLYHLIKNILNVIYTIIYLASCFLLFRTKSIPVRRFFFLLNSSIMSYLFAVILLSSFHISNVPFQRVGLFIPLFIAMTTVGGIFYVKSLQLKLVFCLLVVGNLVIGLYFFYTKLPLRLNNPYPILSDYIVPIPFPVTTKERVQLQENQIKALTLVHPLDDSVVAYFSYIYKVPVINLIPKISTASAHKN